MKSSPFGFQSVKVIALAATDVARAQRFYSETLQLEEDRESTEEVGYRIGESVLIIRQHPPTDDPNPRITLQVQNAQETEKRLLERAVTISDPVKLYEDSSGSAGSWIQRETSSGFVPTPNSQALPGRRSNVQSTRQLPKVAWTGRTRGAFGKYVQKNGGTKFRTSLPEKDRSLPCRVIPDTSEVLIHGNRRSALNESSLIDNDGQFNPRLVRCFRLLTSGSPSVFPDFRPFTILSRVQPVRCPGNPHE
jgi:hypothetical protein